MRISRRFLTLLAVVLCAASCEAQDPQHLFFRVTLGHEFPAPASGRLLIFITAGSGAKKIDDSPFQPSKVYIAAKEVPYLASGESVDVDTDDIAYPEGFSSLKPGDYQAQAVLDVDHTYAYGGRAVGDLVSEVLPLPAYHPGDGPEPVLVLNTIVTPGPAPRLAPEFVAHAHLEDFNSPALGAFFGRPVHIRGWVVLPPDYDKRASDHYPTVYWTHGFGGNLEFAKMNGASIYQRMARGLMPPMIWVMLDESWTTGTHEFADSANNGPWGTALTTEFIPSLEKQYRMDARPSGRFLQGHSSGGWATLQLQINYPQVFGGTWSTSPDPSDFHDFTGIDLYAPHANVYHLADGSLRPLVRDHDKVVGTTEQFAHDEAVLGAFGGQLTSFEWVFSPRGNDGRPLPMFNRATGDIDPAVVAYWHDHYDLANIVTTAWAERGPLLHGKIHVIVGTADTFYLDGAAHKMDAVLKGLRAGAHFTYIPDRTHFDLYTMEVNGKEDGGGLLNVIATEMYAVARPGNAWQPSAGGTQ